MFSMKGGEKRKWVIEGIKCTCLSCDASYCKVSTIWPMWRRLLPAPATPSSASQISVILLEPTFFPVTSHLSHISTTPSTMSFLGSGAPKSNEDIKTALLQQVQQEAAMNNARALIGVRHRFTLELFLSPYSYANTLEIRKSTRTASMPVSPPPALPSPPRRTPACPAAWTSTSTCGTSSAAATCTA